MNASFCDSPGCTASLWVNERPLNAFCTGEISLFDSRVSSIIVCPAVAACYIFYFSHAVKKKRNKMKKKKLTLMATASHDAMRLFPTLNILNLCVLRIRRNDKA